MPSNPRSNAPAETPEQIAEAIVASADDGSLEAWAALPGKIAAAIREAEQRGLERAEQVAEHFGELGGAIGATGKRVAAAIARLKEPPCQSK